LINWWLVSLDLLFRESGVNTAPEDVTGRPCLGGFKEKMHLTYNIRMEDS